MERTIAAIATPQGTGGISVIRISGSDAVKIADKIFSGKNKLSEAQTHTVHYGFIIDENNNKTDEVLVTVMRAPKTFTREDVVEISTHGGIVCVNKVLDAVIKAGASMAEAGEFTKRAFLNGRIDLSQAEAVIDIINSTNTLAQKNALSQLEGSLSNEIKSVRNTLVSLAAKMQVLIDYPDEDLADVDENDILKIVSECNINIQKLLKSADSGKIIRDGIRTAIVGKPNVGKSSILNSLARNERAIVTDVAGTTRDVIEEYVNLDGIPLVLIDTAGIHDTDDKVEMLGVERSRKSIDDADLVLAVFDAASDFNDEDEEILKETENSNRIIIINKNDIQKADFEDKLFGDIIKISAKTGSGLDALSKKIREKYNLGKIEQGSGAVVTNMRHKNALLNASASLCEAVHSLENGMPADIASIDINEAISSLGEITGETVSDSIVSEIFHNFCVGK